MFEMLTLGLIALTAILAGAETPERSAPRIDHDSVPLFFAISFNVDDGIEETLHLLSPSVRRAVDGRLKKRRACKPRFAMPEDGPEVEKEVAFKHGAIECAIIALANRPGVEREAAAYAKDAVLYYEWEGSSEGPIAEAGFAEDYLESHPQTPLAPYLFVFLLHRYRCAFQAAALEGSPETLVWLANQYRTVWARVDWLGDPIVRAVAKDIDGSRSFDTDAHQHPRTFRPAP